MQLQWDSQDNLFTITQRHKGTLTVTIVPVSFKLILFLLKYALRFVNTDQKYWFILCLFSYTLYWTISYTYLPLYMENEMHPQPWFLYCSLQQHVDCVSGSDLVWHTGPLNSVLPNQHVFSISLGLRSSQENTIPRWLHSYLHTHHTNKLYSYRPGCL